MAREIPHQPTVFFKPDRPAVWPYEFVVVEPAVLPAKNWRLRRMLAKPFFWMLLAWRELATPVYWLAVTVQGQPLGYWHPAPGWKWRPWHGRGPRTPWVYEGPITPEIRAMFAAHPERFARCRPEIVDALRGQP